MSRAGEELAQDDSMQENNEVSRRTFLQRAIRTCVVIGLGAGSLALVQQKLPRKNGRTASRRRDQMEITRVGSKPSAKGPAEYFTGNVRVDQPFQGTGPARVGGATVTFEPGARTAWHTHPLGQTLIVVAGCGWVQREGGTIEEIRPGDVVWFAPEEKHWHGATETTGMSHVAIAEKLDGKAVNWLEKVTDEQYKNRT
jgi:quercetin dioxygenase-like cupin family protein